MLTAGNCAQSRHGPFCKGSRAGTARLSACVTRCLPTCRSALLHDQDGVSSGRQAEHDRHAAAALCGHHPRRHRRPVPGCQQVTLAGGVADLYHESNRFMLALSDVCTSSSGHDDVQCMCIVCPASCLWCACQGSNHTGTQACQNRAAHLPSHCNGTGAVLWSHMTSVVSGYVGQGSRCTGARAWASAASRCRPAPPSSPFMTLANHRCANASLPSNVSSVLSAQ